MFPFGKEYLAQRVAKKVPVHFIVRLLHGTKDPC